MISARVLRSATAAAALTLLGACARDVVAVQKGSIQLNVTSAASVAAVDTWRVTMNGPGGTQTRSGSPRSSIQFDALQPGSYSILLEGFDGSDVAARGQSNVTVQAGRTESATVSPTPVLPMLTINASDSAASELGPDSGSVTITRTGPASQPLDVNVALTGTATSATDYQVIAPTITMAGGQRTVSIRVVPVSDAVQEGTETVAVALASGTGYEIGTPASATVTIADAPIVTVTAFDADASEVGPTTGTFRIARTGVTIAALQVSVAVGGAAVNGTDYQTITTPQTIPAGAAFVDVVLTPVADAVLDPDEPAILNVVAGTGYVVGTPASATVTITDAPIVTVTAFDADASEVGPNTGTFRIARTGATTATLVVSVAVGGTAVSGTDYATIATPQTIPAGAAFVDVVLTPVADAVQEPDETAILNVVAATGYVVGTSASATVTIVDPLPTVTVTAVDADAGEVGPNTGTFRITRSRVTTAALPVSVTVGGTAVNGTDYQTITTPQTIPAGAAFVDVVLTPVADAVLDPDETAILNVVAGTGYIVGTPAAATVTIAGTPIVTVTAFDADASEVGPNTGTFRVARTGATTAALAVNVTLGGTAVNGIDYATIATPQTIPAGAAFVDVVLTPTANAIVEPAETAILNVVAGTGYIVGTPASATVTIADAPVVTVTAPDANASEAGPKTGTFRIARTGATTAALAVNVTLGGSAVNGTDYQTIATPRTIPVGASFVDVVLTPLADGVVEPAETAVLTVVAGAGYVVGTPASATITISAANQASAVDVILRSGALKGMVGSSGSVARLRRGQVAEATPPDSVGAAIDYPDGPEHLSSELEDIVRVGTPSHTAPLPSNIRVYETRESLNFLALPGIGG